MIAVVDYGIGNLRSAEKALQHVGADAHLVTDPDVAASAQALVLPGVGAFGACAAALRASGLDVAVRDVIERGVPFLGICVGFQLLFEGSDEDPHAEGLALVPGSVRRLAATERLPQMQWNVVRPVEGRPSRLLGTAGSGAGGEADSSSAGWFYFVHSYAPVPAAEAAGAVVGLCDYGGPVVAAVEQGSLFGTQFHPEKSGATGLQLLRRFASLCGELKAA
ncbi:MAG TPA: imidazole glycerol phosphate synthase subunit HisH [Acidimicrobiales bacterium]|nr:imidazole glycerol phosphate synthase subunit HisH [Acidimicrobiales bacterium]